MQRQKLVDIPDGSSYPSRAQGMNKSNPKERWMDEIPKNCEISDEDLSAARKEIMTYVDIMPVVDGENRVIGVITEAEQHKNP
jgi:CBS domain-containing protein